MSLPPAVIYCDFDGTVAREDVIDVLLTDLADPGWRLVEAEWEQGRIGSRECLARQIPLIQGGWRAIEARLREIDLDPAFPAFASWCHTKGVPLWIVSDGLDRVVRSLLDRAQVMVDAVWANHLIEGPSGALSISFPRRPLNERLCDAGLCKCQAIAGRGGDVLRVVIGDGRSDFCRARRADWLFAKSQLLAHCRAQGMACSSFEDFSDIQRALAHWLDPRLQTARVTAPMPTAAHVG